MDRNELIDRLVAHHRQTYRAMDDQQLLDAWRAAFHCSPDEYMAEMEREGEAFLEALKAMK
jgi:hypothetical protein